MDRGYYSGSDADSQRDYECQRSDLEGNRKCTCDDFINRTGLVGIGGAQIKMRDFGQVVDVLFPQRPIQPVILVELLDDFGGCLSFRAEWTARNEFGEKKGD